MKTIDIIRNIKKAYNMNVSNFIENKDIYLSLLKKFGHYDGVIYEIRREISEGETSGYQWCTCCVKDCPNLTDEEVKYINYNYSQDKNGMFELEIYWSLNI